MAVKKTVIVNVKTQQGEQNVDSLTQDFNELGQAVDKADSSIDSMSKASKTATKSTKDLGAEVGKSGAIIAVLDRFTGGMASQFRDAFEAAKLFTTGLKGIRGALITTGIGALVVALGLIVAYWDDIVKFIKGANVELEKQLSLNKQILSTIKAQSVQSEAAFTELERQQELRLIAAKNRGDTDKELAELEIKFLEEKIKLAEDFETQAITTRRRLANDVTTAEETQQAIDNETAATERLAQANFELARAKALAQGNADVERRVATPLAPGVVAGPVEIAKIEAKGVLTVQEQLAKDLETLRNKNNTQRDIDARNEIERQRAVTDTTLDLAGSLFNSLAGLSKENSDLQKGFAIASVLADSAAAVIATWRGYAAFGPWGTAAAIAQTIAIAASAKQAIQQINSANAAGGAGNIGAPAVSAVGQGGATSAGQQQTLDLIAQNNQVPARAYVVANDVTTQQALERAILNNSSLGTT